MFYLPCSYITTFLMEIPNNINTSRLMRYVLMDLRLGRLSNNERRIHCDKVLTCSLFNFWNLISSDISIYIFYYNN